MTLDIDANNLESLVNEKITNESSKTIHNTTINCIIHSHVIVTANELHIKGDDNTGERSPKTVSPTAPVDNHILQ